jgi:hypothetical protein
MSVAGGGFLMLFSIPFLGIGLVILRYSAKQFYQAGKQVVTIADTATTGVVEPGDAPDSGHAVVTGTVDSGPEGELLAPFSGEPAVAARYGIEQESDGVGWWQVVDNQHADPFVLKGALGRLLVAPGTESLDIALDETTTVGGDESLPAETRDALEASGALDTTATPQIQASAVGAPRKYAEGRLEEGDTLHIYGKITDDSTYGKRIDGNASRAFEVSHDSAEEITGLETEDFWTIVAALVFGLFVLGFGLAFIGGGLALFQEGLQMVIGQ